MFQIAARMGYFCNAGANLTCHVAPPALAQILSIPQRNFLALHARHVVDRWQWHFVGTQLRAYAGTKSATIWRDELDQLVRMDLMEYGVGCADVRITAAGKAIA